MAQSSNQTEEKNRSEEAAIDKALVERARNGDTEAFNELVIRYRERVYAMIYHLVRNEQDAWDVSQEAFVRAWKAMGRFQAKSSFYTWLYRIAHNAAIDWIRRSPPLADSLDDPDRNTDPTPAPGQNVAPTPAPSPDDQAERRDLRGEIDRALATLSEEHRAVVVLKEFDGLSYKEIAEVTDTSIGTVMSRLFYARKKLQTLLKDHYESA